MEVVWFSFTVWFVDTFGIGGFCAQISSSFLLNALQCNYTTSNHISD